MMFLCTACHTGIIAESKLSSRQARKAVRKIFQSSNAAGESYKSKFKYRIKLSPTNKE